MGHDIFLGKGGFTHFVILYLPVFFPILYPTKLHEKSFLESIVLICSSGNVFQNVLIFYQNIEYLLG